MAPSTAYLHAPHIDCAPSEEPPAQPSVGVVHRREELRAHRGKLRLDGTVAVEMHHPVGAQRVNSVLDRRAEAILTAAVVEECPQERRAQVICIIA